MTKTNIKLKKIINKRIQVKLIIKKLRNKEEKTDVKVNIYAFPNNSC